VPVKITVMIINVRLMDVIVLNVIDTVLITRQSPYGRSIIP